MARMFNLRDVFELVNDGFDNGAFAQQDFIHQGHGHILHVGTDTGHQFHPQGA